MHPIYYKLCINLRVYSLAPDGELREDLAHEAFLLTLETRVLEVVECQV